MTAVLCIGDAMIDVSVRLKSTININSDTISEITMNSGGAAANTAAWLAHSGVRTSFAGRVGADFPGDRFLSDLSAQNVEFKGTIVRSAQTGSVVVLVDPSGNRTMFPDSGANAGLNQSDIPSLSGYDAVFLSGYSLFNSASSEGVLEIIKKIGKARIPIFFDIASVGSIKAFGRERAISLINGFEAIFLNQDEASFITETADLAAQIAFLRKLTPLVVIKRGEAGAIATAIDGEPIELPALTASVIDTTGAGDAFAAGFIAAWLESKEIIDAMSKGLTLAARCVETIGARPRVNP